MVNLAYVCIAEVTPCCLSALCLACGAVKGQSRGKEDSTMRNYEVVIIVHPDLDETALNGIVEKIKAWIVDAGGAIDKVDMWGKRHMAYPIKKQRDGQYVLFKVQMAPTFGAELDRNLRFTEPVIRYLVTAVA